MLIESVYVLQSNIYFNYFDWKNYYREDIADYFGGNEDAIPEKK